MDKLHEENLRAEFEKQIREDLLFDDEELEWQPERNCYVIYGVHLAWWGYRASRVKSPVIPDGWIACSERLPEDDDFVLVWPLPDFGVELHVGQYCECHRKGDGWYAQVNEQNYGIEWYPITVTHWQPLPAAPKPEK